METAPRIRFYGFGDDFAEYVQRELRRFQMNKEPWDQRAYMRRRRAEEPGLRDYQRLLMRRLRAEKVKAKIPRADPQGVMRLEDIAKELGLTYDQVHSIYASAIKKLRRNANAIYALQRLHEYRVRMREMNNG